MNMVAPIDPMGCIYSHVHSIINSLDGRMKGLQEIFDNYRVVLDPIIEEEIRELESELDKLNEEHTRELEGLRNAKREKRNVSEAVRTEKVKLINATLMYDLDMAAMERQLAQGAEEAEEAHLQASMGPVESYTFSLRVLMAMAAAATAGVAYAAVQL